MAMSSVQVDRAGESGSPSRGVYVHPLGLCESVTVGCGTKVWAFAQVMSGAVIGADCQIGGHAFVEGGARLGDRVTVKNGAMVWEGVEIGDDVFVGPGVIFTNDRYPRSARGCDAAGASRSNEWLVPTVVERGASIGAGAVVLCGTRIGSFAMVGAGALVTHDVPARALVVGQPARVVGSVCTCGRKIDDGGRCRNCGLESSSLDSSGAISSDGAISIGDQEPPQG